MGGGGGTWGGGGAGVGGGVGQFVRPKVVPLTSCQFWKKTRKLEVQKAMAKFQPLPGPAGEHHTLERRVFTGSAHISRQKQGYPSQHGSRGTMTTWVFRSKTNGALIHERMFS